MKRLEAYLKSFDDGPKAFRKRKYPFVYAMAAIAVVHFAVFYIAVNINSILLAFRVFTGYDAQYNEIYVWALGNFAAMFREFALPNSTVTVALWNTLKYFAVSVLVMAPISYFTAYFLFKKMHGYRFFRAVFFFPSIISAVVYVTMFKNIIGTFGPLYIALGWLGYQLPPLLSRTQTATLTIIFYTVWTGLGINMILYQGAMSRLPADVLEAARIDGAGSARELFTIITPMVWPTLSMTIILLMTGLFNSSGPILLFSEAGTVPGGYNTTTLAFFIFQKTWTGGALEYPAAIGIFFTLVSLPIVIIVSLVMRRLDPEVEY